MIPNTVSYYMFHGIDHHKTCDLFAPQSIQSTEDIFDHSQSIFNLGSYKGLGKAIDTKL